MKSYGMKGEMNPQSKQKADMNPSKGKKMGKDKAYPGMGQGSHDMSPKCKKADEQAVWQNMRS